MSDEAWFADEADAKQYLGEVGRLWAVWLVGLGVLATSRGLVAAAIGIAMLVALFILMSPLQNRVQERFANDTTARKIERRKTLSARDRALRDLTYGRAPFAEAIDKRGIWSGFKVLPWIIIVATLAAAAIVGINWLQ